MTGAKVRSGCRGSNEGWNEEGSREVEMKTADSAKQKVGDHKNSKA